MPRQVVDIAGLYAALDAKRGRRSWRWLARELVISPSTFTRMARGRCTDADTFATLVHWLGMSAGRFIRDSRHPEEVNRG
jgi:hypothetical protein